MGVLFLGGKNISERRLYLQGTNFYNNIGLAPHFEIFKHNLYAGGENYAPQKYHKTTVVLTVLLLLLVGREPTISMLKSVISIYPLKQPANPWDATPMAG